MVLKNVKTWYWVGVTYIASVAIGDIESDGKTKIVAGGQSRMALRTLLNYASGCGSLLLWLEGLMTINSKNEST